MKEKELRTIVFYDGDCPFCNHIVQFVMKNSRTNEVYFSSLQSDFSRKFFHDYNIDFTTFYFYEDFYLYSKSTAAIKLSKHLKLPYSLFRFAQVFPVCFRDKVYDLVAKRRSKLSKDYCIVEDELDENRFISE